MENNDVADVSMAAPNDSECSFANYGVLSLLHVCECKLKKIHVNNFNFSENLRPKMALTDSGPLMTFQILNMNILSMNLKTKG